jgi:hypothetical protein
MIEIYFGLLNDFIQGERVKKLSTEDDNEQLVSSPTSFGLIRTA